MEEAQAYCPPGVGLPTVAHDRGHGITSLRVYCAAGLVCPYSKIFTFDELQLSDDMVMMQIPRVRRFVRTKCGSRKVQIRVYLARPKAVRAILQPVPFRARDRKGIVDARGSQMSVSDPVSGTYWTELRIFLEVANARSFNRAAKRLGLSHPTIGRAVRRLEEELGTQLIAEAFARGIKLTPPPKRYIYPSQVIFSGNKCSPWMRAARDSRNRVCTAGGCR
jgi:DNA-binding CsgD family transcriptional regulator